MYCSSSQFVENNGPGNAFTSHPWPEWIHRFLWCTMIRVILDHWSGSGSPQRNATLVCKTMPCDGNWFEHDKETSSSAVRTKIVYFMHKSSILVAWNNDGRPSFLLWLKLRLFVVFGEAIWRCILCNSGMDFFSVVKLPRLHDAQWIVGFFFF